MDFYLRYNRIGLDNIMEIQDLKKIVSKQLLLNLIKILKNEKNKLLNILFSSDNYEKK